MRKNQIGRAKGQGYGVWDPQGKEGAFCGEYPTKEQEDPILVSISASVETQGSKVWLTVLSNQTLFIPIVLLVFQVWKSKGKMNFFFSSKQTYYYGSWEFKLYIKAKLLLPGLCSPPAF